MTTRAEEEAIEAFCRELALALRRITGRVVEIKPGDLPVPLKEAETDSPETNQDANNIEDTEKNELP